MTRIELRLSVASLLLLFCSIAQSQPVPCPDLAFDHAETLSPNGGLWNMDIGDVDGDGDLDVATVGIDGTFSIYKNRGDGSFEQPVLHVIGEDPRCILLRDLDGDSDLDLIVSNSLGSTLFIYTNPGTGAFDAPSSSYVFPDYIRPLYFAAGDLDGDGDLDIAVSDPYGILPLLWNRGDGRFDYGPTYQTGYTAYEIVAEDLDGDFDLDLAISVGAASSPGAVLVLKNDGSGVFGDPQEYETPSWTSLPLAAADLDGDGDLDLAGTNDPNARPDPTGMWVIFNDGMGHFGPATVYPVGPWPVDVHFGDLDRDGDLDAVVANSNIFQYYPPPHDVSILLNRGDGTFEPEHRETVGVVPYAAMPCDLDCDLDLDIAVANHGWDEPASISVLFNLCDPCDLDRDGDVDLVDYATFRGCFAGPGSGSTPDCALADFDGDGDVDLRDWAALLAAFGG